jgi:hypothetical protein
MLQCRLLLLPPHFWSHGSPDTGYRPWNSASHPEYLAFKHLAVATAHLITSPTSLEERSISAAKNAIEAVTDNKWEGRWF